MRNAVILMALLLGAAGGCSAAGTATPAWPPPATGAPAGPPLLFPAKLATRTAAPAPLVFAGGRLLFGANGVEQCGNANVASDGHRARFTPHWITGGDNSADDLAAAVFCFNLAGFDGAATITLDWPGEPPPPADLFVGVADYTDERYTWLSNTDGRAFGITQLDRCISPTGCLYLAVVLLGEQEYTLNSVLLGERWLVEGVDFTELYAPPLSFELAALRADWAERNPHEEDYAYLGEEVDLDGFRRGVISHVVDGYTHYGTICIPPETPGLLNPVIISCHGGAGGGSTIQADYDFNLQIDDPTFTDQFIVIMPSFRSEPCHGGSVGEFTSGGPSSLLGPPSANDRDADDTIALLDCVLNHFPQADPGNVFIYGFSRGGQVAVRVAERDPRIKGVVSFSAWTDEWLPAIQNWMTGYVETAEAGSEPAYFYRHIGWDLRCGTQSIWNARAASLTVSTPCFWDTLPAVQLHYGILDTDVIEQGRWFNEVLLAAGKPDFEYYEYNAGHSTFIPEGGVRMREFLAALLLE